MLLKVKSIKSYRGLAFVLFVAVAVLSCTNSYYGTNAKWNLGAIYNPSKSKLHPSYKVYHNQENSSIVFFKVFVSELMFQPLGEGGIPICDMSVEYSVFESGDSTRHISDSGTFKYTLKQEELGQFFLSQIPFKAEYGKSYYVKLLMRDNYRKTFNLTFVEVEKKKGFGQQFFNLTRLDNTPLFKNVIIGKTAFKLYHSTPASNKLYISYYKDSVAVPEPTYGNISSELRFRKRDSLFVVNYTPGVPLTLLYNGMYYVQFDTNTTEGVSIPRFERGFPKVTRPGELIEPIAYVASEGAYKTLVSKTNQKLAVDKFWIQSGGSVARGRELIRIYYNRVYFANYYFTNTAPGWKTDRGMIYVVYGPPHDIKKSAEKEEWLYYSKKNKKPIVFTFIFKPDQYQISRYELVRSESQNWYWREAVYSWTNGKIFLLD